MDAVQATAATAATTTTPATTTPATNAAGTSAKSFATLFADAKKELKDGERLTRVKGHEFARIKGGVRDDQCVNLSGNGRNGQVFDLIWRDGRCFHVYGGKGADHKVVEVGTSKKDAASGNTTAGTTTSGTKDGTTSASSGTAKSAAIATGGTAAA
ncbi:hypothetical protein FSW04_22925 [Baekduia soli]|uniref:Uncharacterized protein n=1 Tax=Baekduia soli TaxID=496014 RepID=A0A5B8UAU1_9ACTN|nr:hypothetical protein [Baekduia soli]QEC50145.1 hypothetical protein FSW04_22925 [Baekduia soli]